MPLLDEDGSPYEAIRAVLCGPHARVIGIAKMRSWRGKTATFHYEHPRELSESLMVEKIYVRILASTQMQVSPSNIKLPHRIDPGCSLYLDVQITIDPV